MEKWKKKIVKQMYKQWMSKQKVSAFDIMSYFNNPKNSLEVYGLMLKELENSYYWRFRYFIEKYVFRFKHIEEDLNYFNKEKSE